ncbi:metallophosphoesterase [Candidatus Gracilibacteria bacterium]|nr:metallophosphoesterase [Candidatus Gracilibacteria bacterium]
MPYSILHVSDLHAGPPFNQHVAARLVAQAQEMRPDLLVVSGDFVQRADFRAQWATISGVLAALPQPQLLVPGNHDVPLYNAFQRVLQPYGPYRRHISSNLNPVFERPGLVVVGACSAQSLVIDGGWLNQDQQHFLRTTFARYGDDYCKIAVWHHPVLMPPGSHKRRELRRADDAVRLLDECDVELLLCGHLHVSYIGNTLDVVDTLRQGTIICQSGTTTSKRGKGREFGKNAFNLIEVDQQAIRIAQYLYLEAAGRFVPTAEHAFPRRNRGVYQLPASERNVQ